MLREDTMSWGLSSDPTDTSPTLLHLQAWTFRIAFLEIF